MERKKFKFLEIIFILVKSVFTNLFYNENIEMIKHSLREVENKLNLYICTGRRCRIYVR